MWVDRMYIIWSILISFLMCPYTKGQTIFYWITIKILDIYYKLTQFLPEVLALYNVSTFVFTKDNWSLVKQTVVHFIIITCTCLLCGWLSFWYPHRISGILIAIGECVVTYFIIWFYFYSSYKKSVSKINELTAEK